jgi:hypothetical protein
MIATSVLWVLMLGPLTPSVTGSDVAQQFVIDATKPYVYIRFDHTGRRRPLNEDEGTEGLWLRLVNNCRIPIVLPVRHPGNGDPGAILNYSVKRTGDRVTERELALKLPMGYSGGGGTRTTIEPGEDLLFSIPLNHIRERLYLETRVQLDLRPTEPGLPVVSLVDFSWWDIPEKIRGQLAESECQSK